MLTALRVLHAHGWTHRNITVRTVLVCDDGRVVLTGLAAGAAEEALCGYDPVPGGPEASGGDEGWAAAPAPRPEPASPDPGPRPDPGYAPLVAPGYDTGPRYTDHITPGRPEDQPELKAAARAGAIAAYRAGTRAAAAKVGEQRQADPIVVPEPRPQGSALPQGYSYPYGGPETAATAPWHGATPAARPSRLPSRSPTGSPTGSPIRRHRKQHRHLRRHRRRSRPYCPPSSRCPRATARPTPRNRRWPRRPDQPRKPARAPAPAGPARAVAWTPSGRA